jgi:hypothetical protein
MHAVAQIVDYLTQMMVLVMFLVWKILIHQILTKLGSPLVNADCVADHFGATSCGVGKLASLHPSRLESGNGIDSIEQSKESDATDGSRECLAESFHESKHLVPLLSCLLGLFVVTSGLFSSLPLGKRLPGKLDHLFVAVGQETDIV